jgi:hypothetical protein
LKLFSKVEDLEVVALLAPLGEYQPHLKQYQNVPEID